MGLIALIIAFEYTGFYMLQSVFGIDEGGLGLRIFSIVFFALAMLTFLFKSERKHKDWWYLVIIAGFLGLFAYTRVKFGYLNEAYMGMLLSFGVRGVPAVIAGILVAKNESYFSKMQKWLQVLMIFYTIGCGIVIFTSTESQYLQYKFSAGGINYQTLSYSAAFAFNMNLYLILFWDKVSKFKMFNNNFWKTINVALLLFQIYCMFSGGGRGAVVNITVVSIFLMYVKNRCIIDVKAVFAAVFVVIVVFGVIYFFAEKTGNVGATRIVDFFTATERVLENERTQLRREAMHVFTNNPIVGHGIGSVFYLMGGYSHNIFTDILVEGGVVLLFIAVYIFGKCFLKLKSLIQLNINNTMISMIFFSSFTMLQMSGYFLNDGGIWFGGAYLLYALSEIQDEMNNNRIKMLEEYQKKRIK